jgi:parallel beta-helix repeat protein
MVSSDNNLIMNNEIGASYFGVTFLMSSNNNVTKNHIKNNLYGMRLYISWNNKIYHNNFVNSFFEHAYDDRDGNAWNSAYPGGGNYWSDYSSTCVDDYDGAITPQTTGSPDWMCDEHYSLDLNAVDRHPLTYQVIIVTSELDSGLQVPSENKNEKVESHPNQVSQDAPGIELNTGWNDIINPLTTEMTVSEALSGIPYERVEHIDRWTQSRVPLSDGDSMIPVLSYSIKVNSDVIWSFED